MKRYLKSKVKEFEDSRMIISNGDIDKSEQRAQETLSAEKSDIQKMKKDSNARTQPPLPPNPPPPDSPPVVVKKERDADDEGNESSFETNLVDHPITEPKKEKEKEEIMCRNFFRGTCTRGASCIFAHKVILSQLEGVYTFCKNFQNQECTHRQCKFVHATVFEKEHFLRTGYLPEHALAHLKKTPAPPLPPPTIGDGQQVGPATMMYSLPGTSQMQQGIPTMSMLGPPMQPMDTRPYDMYQCGSTLSDFGGMRTHMEGGEMVKQCQSCDLNEFRLQYNLDKLAEMKRSTEDLNTKMASVSKKHNKLLSLLLAVVKNARSPGAAGIINIPPERENAVMDQINMLLKKNNTQVLEENKNLMSLLTRIVMSSQGQFFAPDQP